VNLDETGEVVILCIVNKQHIQSTVHKGHKEFTEQLYGKLNAFLL